MNIIIFYQARRKKFIHLYKNILPKLTEEEPFGFLEVFVKNAKGEIRCIQYHVRALFSKNGVLEEYQAVGRDITELKKVNAQLDEVNKELHNLSHRLLNEREHDRTELARELHDDILNYISELFMSVSDIPSESAQAIYHKLVEKVRSTIYDLRPPMLSYGLYLGLEDFMDGVSERFGSDTEINFLLPSSVIRFDPNIEIQIFRIIQEACSNALMHANASELTIDGLITEDKVFISVEDNGLGFEYQVDSQSGAFITNMKFGLIGMQERAGLIGADLQVDSEPDKGTKIRLTWIPTSESDTA